MPLNLEKFLESGELADVEFVVKSEKFGTSKTFKAHKQLLALSSEVFKAMFYGQLAEKDTVVITDLHPDGFYGLLKYVYAGLTRIANCFEALHTNAAAEKYLFEKLASACLAYLRMHVDAKEACLLLDCALESGYGSLDKVAEAVLVSDAEAVLRSDAFLSSRLETVHLVLDKSGAMDFKATIAAFLPKLRFLALLPPEFVEFITSEDAQGVMEKEDAFTILCYLIHKGRTDLPEWVCREDVKRLATLSDNVYSSSSTRLGTLPCLLESEYSSSSEYDYHNSEYDPRYDYRYDS
ncbi:BTB/POZ domain-containing protein 6-A-like isoform X3 [Dermacentor albipictus]|uniref:BTB/POZ domain-containing protein 6-A-like isoform X3 n=1 Tax=Dermacentor albipictus TaxID=60249 RepID=UPI0038FCCA85